MDDKLKIFWNLEVLVKMSHSKSDGPSLRVEEVEIEEKIKSYTQEIEEIQAITEEETYDTSAEMADRNIEIITKKQIQSLKAELKEQNAELSSLKEEEKVLYDQTSLLRSNKLSQEKYIFSMQERVGEVVDVDVLDRYNALIAETTEKVNRLSDELEEQNSSYKIVQEKIIDVTGKIEQLEEQISKKKKLLLETQVHLENKDNYVDKTKKEKNNRRITELETKITKLQTRLEELRKDPKYIESKIKDIINKQEPLEEAKKLLIELLNQIIHIPYINVPADNELEQELLRATQARDSFANEIDQKSYNILEAETPEKIRIEFLTDRIDRWQYQLNDLNRRISEIDRDEQYNYEYKEKVLAKMINTMKNDLKEFERAYNDAPDSNLGAKASLKAALDEKKEDLIEAEKIATQFRNDESEDIANATRSIKYECEQINNNILKAEDEIQKIKNRLTSKKSGLIDITSRNKDKDILKELAQIVIDIKHRRQFAETPLEIILRLEETLDIDLISDLDREYIAENSVLIPKDYESYYNQSPYYDVIEEADVTPEIETLNEKKGIIVQDEDNYTEPLADAENTDEGNFESESSEEPVREFDEMLSEPNLTFENENAILTEDSQSEINEQKNEDELLDISSIIESEPSTEPSEEPASQENQESPEVQEVPEYSEPETQEAPEDVETPDYQEDLENEEVPEYQEDTETQEYQESSENQEYQDYQEMVALDQAYDAEPQHFDSNDFSINTMFKNEENNTTSEMSGNMLSNEHLEKELNQYINNITDNT